MTEFFNSSKLDHSFCESWATMDRSVKSDIGLIERR